MAMSELHPRIQRRIDALVDTGAESGLQVAVFQDGALIVDAVAGPADPCCRSPRSWPSPFGPDASKVSGITEPGHEIYARLFLPLAHAGSHRTCRGALLPSRPECRSR
jgi:hypothetical protein